MFTSFRQGAETENQGWDDTPSYVPGRFHAHPLPASPPPGRTAALAGQSPIHSSRSSLRDYNPFTSSSPPTSTTTAAGAVKHRRGVSRRTNLGDVGGIEDRLLGEGGVRGGGSGAEPPDERSWLLLRPGRKRVESWLENWWRRWLVLVGVPCVFVWVWVALPFPMSDPYKEEPPWHLPWPPSNSSSSSSSSSLRSATTTVPVSTGLGTRAELGVKIVETVSRFTGLRMERRRVEEGVVELELLELEEPLKEGEGKKKKHDGEVEVPKEPKEPDDDKDGDGGDEEDLPVDANFYFFLLVYYGGYVAVGLIWITKMFDLYRLNWWPSTLGGSLSYFTFWSLSLLIGFLLHFFDLDGLGRRSSRSKHHDPTGADLWDWERKTTWVTLAFATMTLPALACFAKLRADRRQSYRRSLTAAQKTFLERQLAQRMPRSYRRFLWFLLTLGISLLALIIGQGFATIYLSTLPHNNFEGLTYVWTWIITVQILNATSNWILQRKVRSAALVFSFRFFYLLTYHVFYRNLFARLRSPDQAIYIQVLSSSFVILWYPLSMSKTFWRFLRWGTGLDKEWEEYAEGVATMLYLRNLSENVTMVAFLGWLTILHYGPNSTIYPFFAFDSPTDPYTYRLTATASLVIWATELVSSFFARSVIWMMYRMDVTNIGLDEFREHPELVVAVIWASIHVLMDILLFLIKLNFR